MRPADGAPSVPRLDGSYGSRGRSRNVSIPDEMTKPRLFHDFETVSRVDLKTSGLSRYARDPSTKPLMLAWAVDDEPVEQVVFAKGQKAPPRLREALRDPKIIKSAWNAPFERSIFKHTLGLDIPVEQWRCTMALAYTLSLPGSLGAAGEVVNLPMDKKKDSRGKSLIRKFSSPRKPTKNKPWEFCTWETDPEEFEEYELYNRQDVEAERAIWRRIRKWDMPEHEWALWHLDQRINEAGIPINRRVVVNAVKVAAEVVAERLDEMKKITGLDNPNSTAQLLPWLQGRGYPYGDLKKGHVNRAVDNAAELAKGDAHDDLLRVLELRQEVSKSSVKKYNALQDSLDDDDVLRGAFQFAGAGRTWRWAGRRYQAQNLARPAWYLEKSQLACVRHLEKLDTEAIELLYPKPMDLLSTCVRPVVQSKRGEVLIDADLNAIENRVLGWLAGEDKILQVFRDKKDPYIDFACHLTGRPYEELWHEYKVLDLKADRTTAKPGVLGCGYMLGAGEEFENERTGEIEATGLLGYAWNMGIKSFTKELSSKSVTTWRETYTRAVEYWYEIERAARRCIITGRPQEAGWVTFDRSGPFLRMRLPSGRYLHYCRPEIQEKMMPWGKKKGVITYEGLNDKNQWVRISTHPGKLTENADQAISRDLLAYGMRLAAKEGLNIRMHIHDQIVASVPESKAEESLRILRECMSETPEWAPGLPLSSEGFISPAFIKD